MKKHKLKNRFVLDKSENCILSDSEKKLTAFLVSYNYKNDFAIKLLSHHYPLSKKLLNEFKDIWDWSNDGNGISYNTTINWSAELIELYLDKLVWCEFYCLKNDTETQVLHRGLCSNTKLPLTIDLVDKYPSYFKYGLLDISLNEKLQWSEHLIETHLEKWDWDQLSSNEFLPWSPELIGKFSDKWNWQQLSSNKGLSWSAELL